MAGPPLLLPTRALDQWAAGPRSHGGQWCGDRSFEPLRGLWVGRSARRCVQGGGPVSVQGPPPRGLTATPLCRAPARGALRTAGRFGNSPWVSDASTPHGRGWGTGLSVDRATVAGAEEQDGRLPVLDAVDDAVAADADARLPVAVLEGDASGRPGVIGGLLDGLQDSAGCLPVECAEGLHRGCGIGDPVCHGPRQSPGSEARPSWKTRSVSRRASAAAWMSARSSSAWTARS